MAAPAAGFSSLCLQCKHIWKGRVSYPVLCYDSAALEYHLLWCISTKMCKKCFAPRLVLFIGQRIYYGGLWAEPHAKKIEYILSVCQTLWGQFCIVSTCLVFYSFWLRFFMHFVHVFFIVFDGPVFYSFGVLGAGFVPTWSWPMPSLQTRSLPSKTSRWHLRSIRKEILIMVLKASRFHDFWASRPLPRGRLRSHFGSRLKPCWLKARG